VRHAHFCDALPSQSALQCRSPGREAGDAIH
jgi:hypothetical protein